MRFTPSTFLGSQGECVIAHASGSVSGSFTSGSRDFIYHEFRLGANPEIPQSFQLIVERGYTRDARVIVIGGGGAGGWDGTGNTGNGGGGGGGNVLDFHNVFLSPNTYNIYVGNGGIHADADEVNPAFRTYNGGDGDFSRFWGQNVNIQANGGKGGYGDQSDVGTYLDGGNSGNGFLGGQRIATAGGGAGCTSNGTNGVLYNTGDGGSGSVINLPYYSPTWNSTSKAVGGGGGGCTDGALTQEQGYGRDGGGNFTGDGHRYTGGGGGGGKEYAATPPAGVGTTGGDGFVIVYYPVTDCNPFWGSGSFELGTDLYDACTSPTTTTLYFDKYVHPNLEVGSVYYYDKLFENPVSNGSAIISGSDVYKIGTGGEVTELTTCSTIVSMASGSDSGSACISTTYNNYYYSGSLVVGTSLYSDYNRTILVPDKSYKKSGTVASYNTISGIIDSISSCPIECKNATFNGGPSGGTVTYYNCTNGFQSVTLNRQNVFNTCINVLMPITTGGSTYYTIGSAC